MSGGCSRSAMVPVTRAVRAYFAAYNRDVDAPTVFDPALQNGFLLEAPTSPWIDLGWIDNFQRSSRTEVQVLHAGSCGAVAGEYRAALDAQVEFDFRNWGKLQMALAGGSDNLNALACDPSAAPRPSGGAPLTAVPLLAGSSANELIVGPGAVDAFNIGDLVAADVDFADQAGWVGTGVRAAYVADPATVKHDVNYVRRVTFNVSRVGQKTASSLLLTQLLIGGAPAAGAAVQKVIAFIDREGGSFFQEWSALFIAQEESGGRVCFHYPRLVPVRPSAMQGFHPEVAATLQAPLSSLGMHASFAALPYTDNNDTATVLCYRSYFPAEMSAAY
jgi:hypothetical protein